VEIFSIGPYAAVKLGSGHIFSGGGGGDFEEKDPMVW
jgi:hypothetical protein